MKKMIMMAMMLMMLLSVCAGADALEYSDTITVKGETMTVAQALSTRTFWLQEMYQDEADEIMLIINRACGEEAMNELAITGDRSERLYWLESAAQKGNSFAMYLLWEEYKDADNEKAISYLIQAAEHDMYHAQYDLAMGYYSGNLGSRWTEIEIEVDREKGKSLLLSAAEANVTEALLAVGMGYEEGWYDLPVDREKAFEYYMRAREDGAYLNYDYLTAIEHLAFLCDEGVGSEQNDELTFRLFYEARDHLLSHFCTYSFWDTKLITMYAEGRGTRQNVYIAWEMIEELREDCEGVSIEWSYAVGLMYEKGYGVEKDMEMAEKYYEEARRIEREYEMYDME